MPISPQLLAQWAQPRTQPVDTFMTAYQTGQNNRLQKEALSMKREEALRQRQMDWNKMVLQKRELDLKEKELGKEDDPNVVVKTIYKDGQNFNQGINQLSGEVLWENPAGAEPDKDSKPSYQAGYTARRMNDQGEYDEIDAGWNPDGGYYFDVSDPSKAPLGKEWDVTKEASAASAKDRFPEGALEGTSSRDDASQTLDSVRQGKTLISDALSRIDANPKNVGVAGWTKRNVVDFGVALMEAVGMEQPAGWVYEQFDVQGATDLETLANFISANILPVITAENGRFTNAERAMAQKAAGILEGGKSSQSVRSGLEIVQQVFSMAESRLSQQSGRGASQGAKTPQTQEEFDALESGEVYVDPDDGQLYRKP